MAYTPKTNWQKGEVLEAADMNRVEGGLSDVYTRLDTAATTSITLKAGLQTITSDRDKPFNLTSIRGRLLLNLLGRAGNFETLTGWTAAGTTIALNTANALYGSNCVQITLGSTTGRVSRAINTVSGRTYVVAVETRIGTATNVRVDVTGQGNGNTVTSTNGYQISYMRFTANAATHTVGITVTGANGQNVFADGFRVYEVSPTEYTAFTTLTADTFAAKYPYTEGLAGVKNPYAIRWTDSSKSQLAAMLAFDTELLSGVATDADADTETMSVGTDGQYYKNSMWRRLALTGDMTWVFRTSSTGIKRVQVVGLATGVATTPQGYMVKYDGQITINDLGNIANWTSGDIWQLGDASYNNLILSIATADSGWGESYTPIAEEIRAYFYGWKMYDASTNASDGLGVYNRTDGTNKRWTPLASYDGSSYNGNVATVPTGTPDQVMPNGYRLSRSVTSYELIYRKASTYNVAVPGEGALSLSQGDNFIEIGAGAVIREPIKPQASSTFYWINGNTPNPSSLKNKTIRFLQVYRNNRPDPWTFLGFSTDADKVTYGLQQAQISADKFSVDDMYSVSYVPMQYYPTASFVGVTSDNERAILNDLVHDIEYLTRRVSAAELRKVDQGSLNWTTPTTLNGWGANLGFGYRIEGNKVYFRGILSNGAVAVGTTLFTIPTRMRTLRSFTASLGTYNGSAGQTVAVDFFADGSVKLAVASALTSISFEGLSYSIDQ